MILPGAWSLKHIVALPTWIFLSLYFCKLGRWRVFSVCFFNTSIDINSLWMCCLTDSTTTTVFSITCHAIYAQSVSLYVWQIRLTRNSNWFTYFPPFPSFCSCLCTSMQLDKNLLLKLKHFQLKRTCVCCLRWICISNWLCKHYVRMLRRHCNSL